MCHLCKLDSLEVKPFEGIKYIFLTYRLNLRYVTVNSKVQVDNINIVGYSSRVKCYTIF